MASKVIISAAVTGAIHTPTMSEYVPLTPEDIARQAIDACNAGAASVHVHTRDPENGIPKTDLEAFRHIVEMIKAESDVIVCCTTGGGVGFTVDERVAVVPHLKPELASFNMGSINFALFPMLEKYSQWKFDWEPKYLEMTRDFIFRNTFGDMEKICRIFRENGTKPELEVYDVAHLYNIAYLLQQGLLEKPLFIQFVMGILGGIGATVYDLVHLKQTADRLLGENQYQWSAFGAGRFEFPICTTGVLMGGNCRVGLEDNLNLAPGVKAKSNAELVEKMVRILREFSLEPATPDEGRKVLGIRKKH